MKISYGLNRKERMVTKIIFEMMIAMTRDNKMLDELLITSGNKKVMEDMIKEIEAIGEIL